MRQPAESDQKKREGKSRVLWPDYIQLVRKITGQCPFRKVYIENQERYRNRKNRITEELESIHPREFTRSSRLVLADNTEHPSSPHRAQRQTATGRPRLRGAHRTNCPSDRRPCHPQPIWRRQGTVRSAGTLW